MCKKSALLLLWSFVKVLLITVYSIDLVFLLRENGTIDTSLLFIGKIRNFVFSVQYLVLIYSLVDLAALK
jgi:Ni,Fe-hydrogenase I cytochrome b subunit